MGDILAMIELVKDADIGITNEALAAAKQAKLNKVVLWMTHAKN